MDIFPVLMYLHHNVMAHSTTFLSDFSNYTGHIHYILNLLQTTCVLELRYASITHIHHVSLHRVLGKWKNVATLKGSKVQGLQCL